MCGQWKLNKKHRRNICELKEKQRCFEAAHTNILKPIPRLSRTPYASPRKLLLSV